MQLIDQLAARFEVPSKFVEEYMRLNYPNINLEMQSDDWLLSLSATQHLYATYALSTNQRAKTVVDDVSSYFDRPPKRHLDIGCGYGGLLKAFRSEVSIGIEIAPHLARYTQLNIEDAKCTILNQSVDDVNFSELGYFDLITCTEVLEHVSNPQRLIKNIAGALSEGGIGYIRVPNGRAIDFIRSDGHFLLFGICLLDRQEAKEYKRLITSIEDDYNHMGEYFNYLQYEDWMRSYNLQVKYIGEDHNFEILIDEVPSKIRETAVAFEHFLSASKSLPYFTREKLWRNYARYQAEFFQSYHAALAGKSSETPATFLRDWITNFWAFVVLKK